MKSEIKSEFKKATEKQPNQGGYGFGFINELKEKCLAVKRKILRKHDYVQIPEITKEVNEVLLLAEENDPDFRGSRRKKAPYSLLLEYRHCWKRSEGMEECPLSSDALFMLNALSHVNSDDSVQTYFSGQNLDNLERYFEEFFEENILALVKQAKKKGLTPHPKFQAEMRRSSKPEFSAKGVVLTWVCKCSIANYIVNKAVENLIKNRNSFAVFCEGQKFNEKTLANYLNYIWEFYQKNKEKHQANKIEDFSYSKVPIYKILKPLSLDQFMSQFRSYCPPEYA